MIKENLIDMGFSGRKKIKLGGGFNLNLSKSGISVSGGKKGARVVHHVLGQKSGTTTLYGQKRILGIDGRYIKSFSGKKKGRPNSKSYDFDDFHSSNDVEDFDDYLGEQTENNSNLEYGNYKYQKIKYPQKPGLTKKNKIFGSIAIFIGIIALPMSTNGEEIFGGLFWIAGGSFFLIYKYLQGKNKDKIAKWEKEVEEMQNFVNESSELLKNNQENIIKSIKGLEDYKNELYSEKESIKNHLIPQKDVKDITSYIDFIDSIKSNSQYNGCVVSCNRCKHIWTVKKSFGLPSSCPKCGNNSIKFEKLNSFEKIHKIKLELENLNQKELTNLNEQFQKISQIYELIKKAEQYINIIELENIDELKKNIDKIKPNVSKIKNDLGNLISKLDLSNL
jgi:rubrerythrin